MRELVDILREQRHLESSGYRALLECDDHSVVTYLHEQAREVADEVFGKGIFVRGLVELTNVCRNDCYYCGIRKSNTAVERYLLSTNQVLQSCQQGYELGFRTFVLQGGELPRDKAAWLVELVSEIGNGGVTAPSHSHLVSGLRMYMRHCERLVPTAICFAMRAITLSITRNCTPPKCRKKTAFNA